MRARIGVMEACAQAGGDEKDETEGRHHPHTSHPRHSGPSRVPARAGVAAAAPDCEGPPGECSYPASWSRETPQETASPRIDFFVLLNFKGIDDFLS